MGASTFDPPPFRVSSEPSDEAFRVVAEGEIDLDAAPQLRSALAIAETAPGRSVVLDLSQVTFIDSSGIRVLVEAAQRADSNGHRLSIVSGPSVDRVIEITGLQGRLPLV